MTPFDRICLLIKENNTSGAKMAKDLGFSSGLFSQWKSGKQQISQKKLELIADYFGVTVDYLLGRTDVRTPAAETAQPLTDSARGRLDGWLNQLSESELHELAVYIQFLLYKRGL